MGGLQGKTQIARTQATAVNEKLESGALFAARAETWWLKDVLTSTASLPSTTPYHILVISHGGFIGTLMRSLIHGKKVSCAPGVVVQRCLNTSVTIVDVDHTGLGVIVQWADTSHLKDSSGNFVEGNADEI